MKSLISCKILKILFKSYGSLWNCLQSIKKLRSISIGFRISVPINLFHSWLDDWATFGPMLCQYSTLGTRGRPVCRSKSDRFLCCILRRIFRWFRKSKVFLLDMNQFWDNCPCLRLNGLSTTLRLWQWKNFWIVYGRIMRFQKTCCNTVVHFTNFLPKKRRCNKWGIKVTKLLIWLFS